jgi:hypothetical protein
LRAGLSPALDLALSPSAGLAALKRDKDVPREKLKVDDRWPGVEFRPAFGEIPELD